MEHVRTCSELAYGNIRHSANDRHEFDRLTRMVSSSNPASFTEGSQITSRGSLMGACGQHVNTFKAEQQQNQQQVKQLPQVTISHEFGGSLVEYLHSLSDPNPAGFRLPSQQDQGFSEHDIAGPSRVIRSHSLTPVIGSRSMFGAPTPSLESSTSSGNDRLWGGLSISNSTIAGDTNIGQLIDANNISSQSKARSHSITFGTRENQSSLRMSSGFKPENTQPALFGDPTVITSTHTSTLTPAATVAEAVQTKVPASASGLVHAQESPALKELREWMKSLRLHKYTDRLIGLTYEELLSLSHADLSRLSFTDGAKGKFLKQLQLVQERPERIKEIKTQLEDIAELKELLNILPEIEKLIMMPMLKLTPTNDVSAPIPQLRASSTVLAGLRNQERRHDSGSDSGTEMNEELLGTNLFQDIPHELFELLEKTFSLIVCKQHDDSDRDKVVLHFYKLLERRCLRKEAFTIQHKHMFFTWMKRMDQVWDVAKNQEGSGSVDSKRKFDRKSFRDSLQRRCSLQPPVFGSSSLGSQQTRNLSPFIPQTQPQTAAHPPFLAISTPSGMGQPTLSAPTQASLQQHLLHQQPKQTSFSLLSDPNNRNPPEVVVGENSPTQTSQRRSVPDIITPTTLTSHLPKRNSYQGEMRMPTLLDSDASPGNILDNYNNRMGMGLPGAVPMGGQGMIGIGSFLSRSPSMSSSSVSSRRASTMSMSSWDSGFSRRSSTLSDSSRRNSSICEDPPMCRTSVDPLLSFSTLTEGSASAETSTQGTSSSTFLTVDAARRASSTYSRCGAVSSGCVSDDDRSTDSLEQDLHKLSLAVTEQALLE